MATSASLVLGCTFTPKLMGGGGGGGIGGGGGSITGAGGQMTPGLTAIAITPTTATLMVTNGGPAQTQQYQVMGTVGGAMQDITNEVTYVASPPGIVTISKGGLATSIGKGGGVVSITASDGAFVASAQLTVEFSSAGVDPQMTATVPANASTFFTSTTNDTTRAPQLVYPNDGVLFPPNISNVEVHFMPGANNTLFEVSFTGAISTVITYIRCTTPTGITGCIYVPDPGVWSSVATSNAGQGPVAVVVRGTDDTGTSVGASQTFHMTFARDPVMGALYYWTTSGATAIVRWDFGGTTKSAAAYLTPTNTDGKTCVGCHALSLDGTKVVASAGGQNDGRLLLWSISKNAALQPFPLAQKSQFESWNADGTQFVGVYGDSLAGHKGPNNFMLFDGTTGAMTSTIDLGGLRGDHPDWTKNTSTSNTIVFTSISTTAATTDQRPFSGGIDFVQLSNGAWGAPQTLVPSAAGLNRYYPSINPDGNLVVYDESTCTNPATPDKSCDADTDATATMFLTQLPPNDPTPIALTNANSPGVADAGNTALTNSFPKWAPFIEHLDEMTKVVWMTFASTRQYGLRSPPAPADTDETTKGTLLWMVGVVQGVGGGDPSYTAFCLPFQDITTSNHIAQWTQSFIPGVD